MNSHNIEVISTAKVLDVDGNIIREVPLEKDTSLAEVEFEIQNPNEPVFVHKQPFKSWVENFGRYLGAGMTGGQATFLINWKNTAGSVISQGANTSVYALSLTSIPGQIWGIVVGASAGSTTTSAYQLKAQIAHGVTNGQLQYGYTICDAPVWVQGNLFKIGIRRTFSNLSTSGMVIREVALYAQDTGVIALQNNGPFMIARDILDATGSPLGISVASGGAVEIRYNFYFDTSAGLQTPFLSWIYGGFSNNIVTIPTRQNAYGSTATTTSINFAINQGGLQVNQCPGCALQTLFMTPGTAISMGIVMGASATVTTTSGQDASLASLYPQGFAFGFLNYQPTSLPNISTAGNLGNCLTSATGTSWYAERQAINNSGVTQTVREIGIYAGGGSGGTGNSNFIIYRKPIPDVTLLNGQSMLIGITFQYPI